MRSPQRTLPDRAFIVNATHWIYWAYFSYVMKAISPGVQNTLLPLIPPRRFILWHNPAPLSAVSLNSRGHKFATAAGRRFCYKSGPRPGIRWAGGGKEGACSALFSLPFWLMSRPSPLSLLPGTDVSMTVQSNARAQVEDTDRPELDNKLLQLTSFRQVPLTPEPQFPRVLSGTNDTC